MIADGIIVLMGTIITCCVSICTKVKTDDFEPKIQPRSVAFSIWFIIFICLVISSTFLWMEDENQLIPSILCFLSLLSCTMWLFVQQKSYSFFVLLSALIFSALSSIFYTHKNTMNSAMILLGPNLLFSWLTIANALGFIIYLNRFGIEEKTWMVIPFLLINLGISFANTILGSYLGSIIIILPLLWTALFSQISNMCIFLTIVGIHTLFILLYEQSSTT